MRGLVWKALSHCLHIPDCIQHAVHGIHSLPGKEPMQMIIGAPQLDVFPDLPEWSEVDLRPHGP